MPCLLPFSFLVNNFIFSRNFSFLLNFNHDKLFISCPPGHYRAGPTDCIRYGDCFWTNHCLNGGTCKRSAVTQNATCICPPFFEGALCDIATDRTFLIVGNRDFIIIIIIAIMTLLSKFILFYFILFHYDFISLIFP
jgi:hypothetical protein